MKKTLLTIFVSVLATTTLFSQGSDKVWVLGNDVTNFPVSSGIGAGPNKTVYKDGLGIHTGNIEGANMGQVDASKKSFTIGETTYSYDNRFKFNGAGYPGGAVGQTTPSSGTPAVDYFMPTQRYLSFKVLGNSTIKAHAITGSTGTQRNLFVTDGTKLIGTMAVADDGLIAEYSVTYTGPATTLYLFCNYALNLYYLSATNYDIKTSVNKPTIDKVVSFNGTDIVNEKNLSLEVYNVLGKLIAKSNTTINTNNFEKGIYMVRAQGVQDAFKFSK